MNIYYELANPVDGEIHWVRNNVGVVPRSARDDYAMWNANIAWQEDRNNVRCIKNRKGALISDNCLDHFEIVKKYAKSLNMMSMRKE